MSEQSDPKVGKGNPPLGTRFPPGYCGNPKGRPRGKRRTLPYEAVLGQKVTIRENGVERQLTAAAAFMLQLGNKGLAGDARSARATLEAIDGNCALAGRRRTGLTVILSVYPDPGDVSKAMRSLKMAELLDGFRPTARIAIEPWLVEAALKRLDRQLTIDEQEQVVAATRTPGKVRWPEWWSVKTI